VEDLKIKLWKRFFCNKRAITPVLSNLLLTVIAVVAMSIATTATYVITTNLRENMSERVIVEDLWFDKSTDNIRVHIRNVGKVNVYISTVYVNQHRQAFVSSSSLEIGEHSWLNISYVWTSDSLYNIDIFTARGTHIEGYYKAP
jgi:hypothetical protein